MTTFFVILGVLSALLIGIVIWFARTMKWILTVTHRDRFFQLPLTERRALRRKIEKKARWINLLMLPLSKLGFRLPLTRFEGVEVPGICTPQAMEFARDYKPGPEDVFVATQMKCGTTWMQQIVHQVLSRGEGEIRDDGHRHLYTISPWIESEGSVQLKDAPLINGRRIVKTHLGTNLCPYSPDAKYIYVVRHPAACLASSIDFVTMLMGRAAPQYGRWADWFCSDQMWWGSWPDHVEGWWRWSQEKDNVMFVHYEDLLENTSTRLLEIGHFLGIDLTPEELAKVAHKSSYKYMKDNEFLFEMSPPTPLYTGSQSYFVNGSKNRGDDISDTDRERVKRFCLERLAGATYPVSRFYPDVI